MALFSMRAKTIGRSSGRSSIAAAAYRAGEKLHDQRTGKTCDYSRRSGVEHKEILVPSDAPAWVRGVDRETLWNTVEAAERRKDSQTAREVRIMIPREFDLPMRTQVVRDFVERSFVSRGMVADICWHNKVASDGQDQPHAHVMLTTRFLSADGFGLKSRHEMIPDPDGRTLPNGTPLLVPSNPDSWNLNSYYEACRENWEMTANDALARLGSAERIDRRSYLERGIARLPEPALRLAYHLKELYGVMRERFGQFQVARHYRAVEDRAKAAFQTRGNHRSDAGENARIADRYFDWIERQVERLAPEPQRPRDHDRGMGH